MRHLLEGFRHWGTLTEDQMIVEGLLDDVLKKYSTLPRTLIDLLSEKDPSKRNKYLMWAAKQLNSEVQEYQTRTDRLGNEVDHDTFESTALQIASMVEKFHKNVQRLKNKDLNSYKTLTDLEKTISDLGLSARKQKSKKREEAQANSTNIEETDQFWMIRPDSKEASCYYGQQTRWCISATKSQNYFDQYTKEGKTFYMVMLKNLDDKDKGKKLALVYGRDSGGYVGDPGPEEVYNAADDEIGEDGMEENVAKNIIGEYFTDYERVWQEFHYFKADPSEETYTDNLRKLAVHMSEGVESEISSDDIEASNTEDIADAMDRTFHDATRDMFSSAYYHHEENPGGPNEEDYQEMLDIYEGNSVHAHVSMEDYGEGTGIFYNGYMSFELDVDKLEFALIADGDESDALYWADEISKIFSDVASNNHVYPDEVDTETYSGFRINYTFNPDAEQGGSIDGFESFLDMMSEYDKSHDTIMEESLEEMAEEGITRSSEFDAKKELYGKLSKLKNFDTNFEKGKMRFWLKENFKFTLPLSRAMDVEDVIGSERKEWIQRQLKEMSRVYKRNIIFKRAFHATWQLARDNTQEKKKQQPMFSVTESAKLYQTMEGVFNILDFSLDNGGTVSGEMMFTDVPVDDSKMLNYMSWLDNNLDIFYDAMAKHIVADAEDQTEEAKRHWPEKFKSTSVDDEDSSDEPQSDLDENVSYGRLCESWRNWSEG